ncbi:unnamed protein product [Closterium sp. Yama58-4]|nr:unnamed protein product [Closterium sp. Yama58-4]
MATMLLPLRNRRRPLQFSAYDDVLDPDLFDTVGELGRSGFGTVVAIRRVDCGEVVAVNRVARKQMVAAANEAMVAASLSECPGVLGVREVHLADHHAYLLSDLCSGGNLRALLQRRAEKLRELRLCGRNFWPLRVAARIAGLVAAVGVQQHGARREAPDPTWGRSHRPSQRGAWQPPCQWPTPSSPPSTASSATPCQPPRLLFTHSRAMRVSHPPAKLRCSWHTQQSSQSCWSTSLSGSIALVAKAYAHRWRLRLQPSLHVRYPFPLPRQVLLSLANTCQAVRSLRHSHATCGPALPCLVSSFQMTAPCPVF